MKLRKVFYLDVILPDWVNDNIERGLTEAVDKYEKQEEEEGLKSVSQKKERRKEGVSVDRHYICSLCI